LLPYSQNGTQKFLIQGGIPGKTCLTSSTQLGLGRGTTLQRRQIAFFERNDAVSAAKEYRDEQF
jgi:hypothetical protein